MLLAAFNEVVISTAFVECLFAQFKQWLLRIPKPPSVSLLAGQHMQSSFKRSCESKRARHATGNDGGVGEAAGHRQRTKRRRPEWVFRSGEQGFKTARLVWVGQQVKKRGHGVSSRKAFADASCRWRDTSPASRKRARQEARARNKAARQLKADSLTDLNNAFGCRPFTVERL